MLLHCLWPAIMMSLCRDQSASATFYFKTESEGEAENQAEGSASDREHLVKEWMYYEPLQHGVDEFKLRNNQVKKKNSDPSLLSL